MRDLEDIHISIRWQAAIVIVLTVIWYVAWWLGLRSGKGFLSNLHFFWGAAFFLAPLIAAIFSAVMIISCMQGARSYRWLVYFSVSFAITPWVCFFLFR